MLALVGLVVLVVELVAYGLLGWTWWLVANGAALILIFMALLALRRKGKGGLFDRLLAAVSRGRRFAGRSASSGGAARSGLLGRMGSGRTSTAGGPGMGTRRGGLLGRLGRMRQRAGGPARSATGSPRSGAPTSRGGRARSALAPLGRRSPRSAPGSSAARGGAPGGRAARSARRWSAIGRRPGTAGSSTNRGDNAMPAKSRQGPILADAFRKGWAQAGKDKPGTQTTGPATGPSPQSAEAKPPPQPGTKEDLERLGPQPEELGIGTSQQSDEMFSTQPRHPAGPNNGGTDMTEPMGYADDQSLQRWGANLGGAEQGADEVARLYAEAEAAAERYRQVFGQVRSQGESALPVSPTLLADVQDVDAQAQRAQCADEWRGVSATAAALPGRYAAEHETDNDRLNSPRNGIEAEKRADVSTAVQDN